MCKTNLENKNALQFNQAIMSYIDQWCQPLRKHFQIKHFAYIKFYNDGSMLRLGDNIGWLNSFFNYNLYNDKLMFEKHLKALPLGESAVHLLTGTPQTLHENLLFQHGLWNFYIKYTRYENFIEFVCYAGGTDNTHIIDFYLNNEKTLDLYRGYFTSKLQPFISDDKDRRIVSTLNTVYKPREPHNLYAFYEDIRQNIDKKSFSIEELNINIAPREVEVLFYLQQGKTFKEIAQYMQISSRTVEKYISHIKVKCHLSYKSELVDLYHRYKEKFENYLTLHL